MKRLNNMKSGIILLLAYLLFAVVDSKSDSKSANAPVKRSDFPPDFIFGSATSAYQVEGAVNEGGRTPSIWDTFVKQPNKIKGSATGDVAADSYHHYQDDVSLLKYVGFTSYRFSISWNRILPGGNLKGGVNKEGIQYYNNLIDQLKSNGLEPLATIFHWDLPQSLEDEYGGFLSPKIVDDFKDYAEVCFKEFGEKVKMWATINEPYTFSTLGYEQGLFAPGRCSSWLQKCKSGNSSTEPYIVSHNFLLAHAATVSLYREKYQSSQKGKIGIVLNTGWQVPISDSQKDKDAASRALAFAFGWFMEPLKSGSYPEEMVKGVGERLPKFSEEESKMVKGSYDYIGVNYYGATYAADIPCSINANHTASSDACVNITSEKNGVPIGPVAASSWLYIYPEGLYQLLVYIKEKFNNPVIYITENGVDEVNTGKMEVNDKIRKDYIQSHLYMVQKAIKDGVNVKGYYAWALLDNFEWIDGYSVRFGLFYVDFENKSAPINRIPKQSAIWFRQFLLQKS